MDRCLLSRANGLRIMPIRGFGLHQAPLFDLIGCTVSLRCYVTARAHHAGTMSAALLVENGNDGRKGHVGCSHVTFYILKTTQEMYGLQRRPTAAVKFARIRIATATPPLPCTSAAAIFNAYKIKKFITILLSSLRAAWCWSLHGRAADRATSRTWWGR